MRKLAYMLFFGSALSFLPACQDFQSIDDVKHEPEIAVPIASSSMSLGEFIEDEEDLSFIEIAADGSMSISYEQEQVSKEAKDMIGDLEDFPLALVDSFMSVQVDLFDNIEVTKIQLKSGTINFDIQSSYTENIDLKITFPGMMNNGLPFEVETSIVYQGTTPVETSITPQTVQGFDLNMPNGKLDIRYEAYNQAGERVLVDAITGEAKNWEYSAIEGIWDNENISIASDTIDIEIFEDWTLGQIHFEDPKLVINVDNSIGFPMQIKLENLIAHTASGNTIPLNSELTEGYTMDYPELNEMSETKSTKIILDKSNSNIVSVFNSKPLYITYNAVAIINPESENTPGFIMDNSRIGGSATIELPLHGTASAFTFEEYSDFEMEEMEEITHATFKLVTSNEIPVDLSLQLYFQDINEQIIDSLFSDQRSLLAAPQIGANGTIVNPTEQETFVEITAERFDNIKRATSIKTIATFSTANDGTVPVKVMTDQELSIRLGAILGFQ